MKPCNRSEAALSPLDRLLNGWKDLTEAERLSIISKDWSRLEAIQEKKSICQRAIEEAEATLTKSTALTADELKCAKGVLRRRIEELLHLEEENRKLLAREMASTNSQLKVSDKAIRSLRNVQHAYGTGNRSFWHAYS